MEKVKVGTDVFESGCELVDATSLNRPDTNWRVIDAHGHEHRWYVSGQPATSYSPSAKHETPTLVGVKDEELLWVKDGEEMYEDDDEPRYLGHLECRQCGERIEPRYCADSSTQYIPGPHWHSINGRLVSKDEFERRWAEATRG